jgi:hypothetical protein
VALRATCTDVARAIAGRLVLLALTGESLAAPGRAARSNGPVSINGPSREYTGAGRLSSDRYDINFRNARELTDGHRVLSSMAVSIGFLQPTQAIQEPRPELPHHNADERPDEQGQRQQTASPGVRIYRAQVAGQAAWTGIYAGESSAQDVRGQRQDNATAERGRRQQRPSRSRFQDRAIPPGR